MPDPGPGRPGAAERRDVYSVSRLTREVRQLLEGGFPLLWIEGELSNLSRPSSGHMYFTLKDRDAQVRCAMFRSRNALLGFAPADGMQVCARARISLYEPRGEFQLVVDYLEPSGEGALRLAFEQLKRKLAAEGLFDSARKRAPPAHPRAIGVVTSPTGAALRDVLSVLGRRCPGLPVIVYPVPVQGPAAAGRIAAMLARAGARAECDVLLLVRGGGSLEDLQSFNDERVARAVAGCGIPVVTGVGHEIDFTIADFAADLRAPTPSAAAELASPDLTALRQRLGTLEQRLAQRMTARLDEARRRCEAAARRLLHPGRRLQQSSQRLDEARGRLGRALRLTLDSRAMQLQGLHGRLLRSSPLAAIAVRDARLQALQWRLGQVARQRLAAARARVDTLARALDAVSPLATLARGYALVRQETGGALVRDPALTRPGERLRIRVARGEFTARVVDDGEGA